MSFQSDVGWFLVLAGVVTMTQSVLPFTRWFAFSSILIGLGLWIAIGTTVGQHQADSSENSEDE